jgi:hypothetical protein
VKNRLYLIVISLMLPFLFLNARDREGGIKSLEKNVGTAYQLEANLISLYMANTGETGGDGHSYFPTGNNVAFLYSGGIAMSGFVNGQLRVSWQAAASRIEDMLPGPHGSDDPNNPDYGLYVVTSSDEQGDANFVDWARAVELGADYVDVDGDGTYNPNIDKPDLIGGDYAVFGVYNDGKAQGDRAQGTPDMDIEIQQMAWAFSRGDALGNVVFFRYRIINNGENIDDFIFSGWTDPDLGDYQDDLIGSDTTFTIPGTEDVVENLGYVYNNSPDAEYGVTPPAFGIDFFQGPIIPSPGDTATRVLGPNFGVQKIPGYKNLGLSSFTYYVNGIPELQDPQDGEPNVCRRYQTGGVDRDGNPLDPSTWGAGGTAETNPIYWYSGDPVAGTGWLDNVPSDKRFMVNTGPFTFAAGDTQDIVMAYIVAQAPEGEAAVSSVNALRVVDISAQFAFDNNFDFAGPPPAIIPHYNVIAGTDTTAAKIDVYFDITDAIKHDVNDGVSQQVFQGFEVWQYRTFNDGDVFGGQVNRTLVGRFDVADEITRVFANDGGERGSPILWPE